VWGLMITKQIRGPQFGNKCKKWIKKKGKKNESLIGGRGEGEKEKVGRLRRKIFRGRCGGKEKTIEAIGEGRREL